MEAATATQTKWEYKARNMQKVLGPMTEGDFNRLGQEGWEFVAMVQGGKSGYAIFKRRLQG